MQPKKTKSTALIKIIKIAALIALIGYIANLCLTYSKTSKNIVESYCAVKYEDSVNSYKSCILLKPTALISKIEGEIKSETPVFVNLPEI